MTRKHAAAYLIACTLTLLAWTRGIRANGPLEASGVIQVEEVRLASELQGQVVQISVQNGATVTSGQTLVVLDSRTLQANVRQAQAALEAALADLALARARPRAEVLAGKQADLDLAKAQQLGAHAAWQAALERLHDPQDLKQQILQARARAALAAQSVEVAQADYQQAQYAAEHANWNSTERYLLDLQAAAKKTSAEAARADESLARLALQRLEDLRDRPFGLQALAHSAGGRYLVVTADVLVAQAELDDAEAGPTLEEMAVADANVALARAQLRLAQAQYERLTIRAPVDGVVLERNVNVGEMAMAGVTLVTVADLSQVYLVAYVPESGVGELRLGQKVIVSADGFPQGRFEGLVAHIADQPQYTPRNVATKEERVNTVYAVRIRLSNPEGLLKPGMAADVVFVR